jgi:1-acyl-sn-glycerol-3-phosphate acyltransferase
MWLDAKRRAPGWPAWRILFWWTLVRGLILLFFSIAYRIRRSGAEHIPRSGPIIYVANHQSHYDPPIVGVLVTDRPFSGMARSGLFKSKVLAWIMRGIGSIELEQGKGDTAAMKAALAELEKGRNVLIYPEGTRTRDGALGEFHRGAILLIKRSGAQVVPVAMEGAFDIWPIGTSIPKLSGRMAVKAAPAIPAHELLANGPDAALEYLKRAIETMRMELRAQMRRSTNGKFPPPGPGDFPYWKRSDSLVTLATRNPSNRPAADPLINPNG